MQSICACNFYPYTIPCNKFIWNNPLSQPLHWSDQIQLKSIHQKQNTLTLKHSCACASLLRLLLRHIYLIRLNQHRVVMIKHFSFISVWERDTQTGGCLSKGGKARAPPSLSFSPSNCLSLLSLVFFPPRVPLFVSLCYPLSAFLAASLCISGDTS